MPEFVNPFSGVVPGRKMPLLREYEEGVIGLAAEPKIAPPKGKMTMRRFENGLHLQNDKDAA